MLNNFVITKQNFVRKFWKFTQSLIFGTEKSQFPMLCSKNVNDCDYLGRFLLPFHARIDMYPADVLGWELIRCFLRTIYPAVLPLSTCHRFSVCDNSSQTVQVLLGNSTMTFLASQPECFNENFVFCRKYRNFCLQWRHCDVKCWQEELRKSVKYRNAGNCGFQYQKKSTILITLSVFYC